MTNWRTPSALAIDNKLRADFRRMLIEDYGIKTQQTDPILAVLFRSFANQIKRVYEQANTHIPRAVLDELMSGLGMPAYLSQPAQSVIRFSLEKDRQWLEAGTNLLGEAQSRERLFFALDTPIEISQARICFVVIYVDGQVKIHRGTGLSKEFDDARPSFDPVPAELGPNPAIFTAIEVHDERHLSNHGFYFELSTEAKDLLHYLHQETWCLLDNKGEFQSNGLLRSYIGNAGVRKLSWLVGDASSKVENTNSLLAEGFYGNRIFIFPKVPSDRRFLTGIPEKMKDPISKAFLAGKPDLVDKPRAWLQISLPQEANNVYDDLKRIMLHCTTASNVEEVNQTIDFRNDGTSTPISNDDSRRRHLIRVVSIIGDRGSRYRHESDPKANEQTGRYRFRQRCLEIVPARTTRGVDDRYANVRLLLSNGSLDDENGIGVGAIENFSKRTPTPTLKITNLTPATGGTNEETYEHARQRFAELLLARDRIVTRADLEASVKAFEPKVNSVECRPELVRTHEGLRRVHQIMVSLDKRSFTLLDEEAEVLKNALQRRLQERALAGLEIRVAIKWT